MKKHAKLLLAALALSLFSCQSSVPKTAEDGQAETAASPTPEKESSLQAEALQEAPKEYWKELNHRGQWFEGTLKDIPIWLYLSRVDSYSDGDHSYGIHYGYNSSQGASIYLTGKGDPSNIEVDLQKFEAGELVDGDQLTGEWANVEGKRFPMQLKAVGHEKYSQAKDLMANLAALRLPIIDKNYYEGLDIEEHIKPHYVNKNFGLWVPNFKSLLGDKTELLEEESAVVWGKIVQPNGETLLLYTATGVMPEFCRFIAGTYLEDPKNMLAAALFDKTGRCLWNSNIGNAGDDPYYMDFSFSIKKVNRIGVKWTTYMRGERGARMIDEEFEQVFDVNSKGLEGLD
ncbi:hypothetical protein [Saprospira grandis]|uniref:hypothetical protein n=1 Tax=Saprospira grandis TaxID=1008 RepID=UPI0022DE2C81|nr:hypothetical protein [Saprospira grandis]WBM73581.1 hypothetical protein OP864_11360 [Saprospira grandis]